MSAASEVNSKVADSMAYLNAMTPVNLRSECQKSANVAAFVQSKPELLLWMTADNWTPHVEFNGRPYATVNGEKVPANIVQYKMHTFDATSCTIEARIYKATQKFKSPISNKANSPQLVFTNQVQQVEKAMAKIKTQQQELYSKEKAASDLQNKIQSIENNGYFANSDGSVYTAGGSAVHQSEVLGSKYYTDRGWNF